MCTQSLLFLRQNHHGGVIPGANPGQSGICQTGTESPPLHRQIIKLLSMPRSIIKAGALGFSSVSCSAPNARPVVAADRLQSNVDPSELLHAIKD